MTRKFFSSSSTTRWLPAMYVPARHYQRGPKTGTSSQPGHEPVLRQNKGLARNFLRERVPTSGMLAWQNGSPAAGSPKGGNAAPHLVVHSGVSANDLHRMKGRMSALGHTGNTGVSPHSQAAPHAHRPMGAFGFSPQSQADTSTNPAMPSPSPLLLSADFVTQGGDNFPVPTLDFSPQDPYKRTPGSPFKQLIPPIFTGLSAGPSSQTAREDSLARPYQVDGLEHVRIFDNWNQGGLRDPAASNRRKSMSDESFLNARAGWRDYQAKYLGRDQRRASGKWDFSPPSPEGRGTPNGRASPQGRHSPKGRPLEFTEIPDFSVQDSGKNRTGLPMPSFRTGAPPVHRSGMLPSELENGNDEEEYDKFCLGIVWVLKAGRLLVAGFNPRSTAHALGVRSGDILKAVDGIEILNLEADCDGRHEAGELMLGREQTQCKLTLLRLVAKDKTQQLYQIDVTLPRSISVMDLNVQSY